MTSCYCLRWSSHDSCLIQGLERLLAAPALLDVTLVCADGVKLQAHKLVLSACSSYFEHILNDTQDRQPLIVLRDVAAKDMRQILAFVYRGELTVNQQELEQLLRVAHALRIKGLVDLGLRESDDNLLVDEGNGGTPRRKRARPRRFSATDNNCKAAKKSSNNKDEDDLNNEDSNKEGEGISDGSGVFRADDDSNDEGNGKEILGSPKGDNCNDINGDELGNVARTEDVKQELITTFVKDVQVLAIDPVACDLDLKRDETLRKSTSSSTPKNAGRINVRRDLVLSNNEDKTKSKRKEDSHNDNCKKTENKNIGISTKTSVPATATSKDNRRHNGTHKGLLKKVSNGLFHCERCGVFFKSRKGFDGHMANKHNKALKKTHKEPQALNEVLKEIQSRKEAELVQRIIAQVKAECEARGKQEAQRRGYQKQTSLNVL